jgi:hypothetical protein
MSDYLFLAPITLMAVLAAIVGYCKLTAHGEPTGRR